MPRPNTLTPCLPGHTSHFYQGGVCRYCGITRAFVRSQMARREKGVQPIIDMLRPWHTLEETADKLGISWQAVQQIERKALAKVRDRLLALETL